MDTLTLPEIRISAATDGASDDLTKLIQSIAGKLAAGDGKWGDLSEDLREALQDALRDTPIHYRPANDPKCPGTPGQVLGGEILLCPGANESVLLHELVHVAGGSELDAEAIENHLYLTKNTPPTYDDFEKFISVDDPCAFTDGKKQLVVSNFVIWDPASGKLWLQTGTRAAPRKGRELRPRFPADRDIRDRLKANPLGSCSPAQKCGARCKDFDTYGLCDRKVRQPPCYQHRA